MVYLCPNRVNSFGIRVDFCSLNTSYKYHGSPATTEHNNSSEEFYERHDQVGNDGRFIGRAGPHYPTTQGNLRRLPTLECQRLRRGRAVLYMRLLGTEVVYTKQQVPVNSTKVGRVQRGCEHDWQPDISFWHSVQMPYKISLRPLCTWLMSTIFLRRSMHGLQTYTTPVDFLTASSFSVISMRMIP